MSIAVNIPPVETGHPQEAAYVSHILQGFPIQNCSAELCARYGDPYWYGWYGRYGDPYLTVPVPANGVTRTVHVRVLRTSSTGPVPQGTGPVPEVQFPYSRYGSPYHASGLPVLKPYPSKIGPVPRQYGCRTSSTGPVP